MTRSESQQSNTIIPNSVDAYLERYTPRQDYLGQWLRLRPEVLSLVRQMAPMTIEQATGYLASLGKLLAGELAFDDSASLAQLLTDAGINRTLARLNLASSSRRSTQGHRTILTHLHRCLAGLPPVLSGPRQVRTASEPVTAGEVDELLNYLIKSLKSMDLHVRRRLILALGAGLTGAKADAASIAVDSNEIIVVTDKSGKVRPLSKKWTSRLNAAFIPELETYLHPSEQALSGWLRHESLSYLWPRMRDEWLLEQMDGTEPALVQMRRAEITEYDMNRLLLRWAKIPLTDQNASLRERKVFL
jgi:hypothetical protein